MQRFHVKRGDPVVVISGSHRGKEGKILEVLPAKNRARVEGVAMVKRHTKKSQEHPQGAIVEREGSVHISNLMLKSVYDSSKRKRRRNNMSTAPILKKHYTEKVYPELMKLRGYTNKHQVPRIVKVNLNSGIDAEADKNQIADVQRDLSLIAGQKPVLSRTRKAISNFKLKENQVVGCHVTLRGDAMWEFLYRLLAVALPDHPRLPRRLARSSTARATTTSASPTSRSSPRSPWRT